MFSKAILRDTATQDLSAAGLTHTLTLERDAWLHAVLLNFQAGVSETVTLTFDSADGATYDVVIDTSTLSTEQYYAFRPSFPMALQSKDGIKVTTTNNSSQTVRSTILYQER